MRGRIIPLAGVALVAVLLATACSGGGSSSSPSAGSSSTQAKASASAAVQPAAVRISPANGSRNVNPSAGVTVTAARGKLTKVSVSSVSASSAGGGAVSGTMSQDGTSWHSTWALGVSQSYQVSVTDTASSAATTSTFRTLTPAQTLVTQIFEGYNQTYGVGMPIMLTFSQPITNKAAVERSLEVTTSKPVVGAWYWDGDEKLFFRPRDYWPADTTVSFTGHLDGVEGAAGSYGAENLTQTFRIGRSLIAVASTTSHRTHIYLNGQLKYNWPVSTGRASLPTPNGSYLSVEKHNPVRMIGGGPAGSAGHYDELVNYAVRFTFSGDYYHSAPWSVVNQGTSNVSHGCVNLPPEDAIIYYNMSIPGDPITITNSGAAGKWDDGWTPWFLSWSHLVAGSALHQAVQAGPTGSTFVAPATLPSDTATAPTGTSAPGNYQAGAG